MIRYFIVSIANGFLFGVLDGIINANPFAQKLFQVYAPIARTSINAPLGIVIDIAYGLAMGLIFLILYKSLPGKSGLAKGVSFGLVAWFFRVLMGAVSDGMMLEVPPETLSYSVVSGLLEMLVIGVVYGAFLKPGQARPDRT